MSDGAASTTGDGIRRHPHEASEVAPVGQGETQEFCGNCDHGLVWDPRVDGNVVPCQCTLDAGQGETAEQELSATMSTSDAFVMMGCSDGRLRPSAVDRGGGPSFVGAPPRPSLEDASLRDIRARAEAFLADGPTSEFDWQVKATSFARDCIALTLSVERLLVRVQEEREMRDSEARVRVQELTDEREAYVKREGEVNVERQRQEVRAELAERRVQEAERALRAAPDCPPTDREYMEWFVHVRGAWLGGDGQQEQATDSGDGSAVTSGGETSV